MIFSHLVEEIRFFAEGDAAEIWVTDPKTGKKVKYTGPVTRRAKAHSPEDQEKLTRANEKAKRLRGVNRKQAELRGGANFGGSGYRRKKPPKKTYESVLARYVEELRFLYNGHAR